MDEFARTHRELVVGGVGLAVAVPSLIGAFVIPWIPPGSCGAALVGVVVSVVCAEPTDRLIPLVTNIHTGGTRRAVVNGVLAAGVTAGVFGFSEWWERRHQEEAGKK